MTGISNTQNRVVISKRLPCSRSRLEEATQAKRAQHNACTMWYKTTNFIWTFASPLHGLYKDIRDWKGPTSVLAFPIHSGLTVFLFSVNMLLSLACLWTLPHNVFSEQFWWIISSCTGLTAGHTHVGASSGLGRVFSYWYRTNTCSPAPLKPDPRLCCWH